MLEIKIFQVCLGNNILDLVKKNNTLKQLYFSGTCGIYVNFVDVKGLVSYKSIVISIMLLLFQIIFILVK